MAHVSTLYCHQISSSFRDALIRSFPVLFNVRQDQLFRFCGWGCFRLAVCPSRNSSLQVLANYESDGHNDSTWGWWGERIWSDEIWKECPKSTKIKTSLFQTSNSDWDLNWGSLESQSGSLNWMSTSACWQKPDIAVSCERPCQCLTNTEGDALSQPLNWAQGSQWRS